MRWIGLYCRCWRDIWFLIREDGFVRGIALSHRGFAPKCECWACRAEARRWLTRVMPEGTVTLPPREGKGHVFETEELADLKVQQRSCDHEYVYMARGQNETYTGYCEQCTRCGKIVQIPQ